MSSVLTGLSAQQNIYYDLSLSSALSGVRGSLNQQKQEGQAALNLIAAAAIPIDPHVGQNIDLYA